MASLPEHEQIFLMWLEVCSTTSIIFPDTSASKMDFESGYNEILAYMFKCKYITGIPTNPLSHARDKFDMILIESRDKSEDSIKYDFVHPSYHEAFWYAIHKELPLNRWWDLLKENIGAILEDLKNKVDMVQLRMIERYGAINRDLNQLLLISAECDDPNEQLIAFEHMVERLKQFAHAAQFLNCALSISSSNLKHKQSFLHIVEPHLDRLPLEILNIISTFLFDKEADIRKKAGKIILKHFDNLPESFKLNEKMQIWQTARNIFVPFAIRYPFILSEYFRTEEIPAADSEFDIPYIIDNFSKYSWQWTYRGGLSENY
ncbi:MAG: hypothetical protein LUQ20_05270, partial [Candidatus Methanoperedens sp.]|nr:hypothetical protein [Candidatus Methanoperedens sp.]